jgi:hypothetical protein
MSQPVFIISTGRTGTTFLAETLRRLEANAAHEPGPRWLRLLSNAFVAGAISHDRTIELLKRARPPEATFDVEASCLIYGLTTPILEAKPDAHVVHLIRDPRTYVRSAMNWGVHRPGGRPLNLIPYRRLAPSHLEGRTPTTLIDWARSGQFARVCWTWQAMNRIMRDDGADQDRFTTIRMEDVFDSEIGYAGFVEILELAGLATPSSAQLGRILSESINAAPRQSFPHWEQWNETQLHLLVAECGDLADEYDYPVRAEVEALLASRPVE